MQPEPFMQKNLLRRRAACPTQAAFAWVGEFKPTLLVVARDSSSTNGL